MSEKNTNIRLDRTLASCVSKLLDSDNTALSIERQKQSVVAVQKEYRKSFESDKNEMMIIASVGHEPEQSAATYIAH